MNHDLEQVQLDNPEAVQVPGELLHWTTTQPSEKLIDSIIVTFHEGTPIAAQVNRSVGAFDIGPYAGLEHLEQSEKVQGGRRQTASWNARWGC